MTDEAIVIGTGDKRGLSRLFLGSVAADVAHRAACTVIIARYVRAARQRLPVGQPDAAINRPVAEDGFADRRHRTVVSSGSCPRRVRKAPPDGRQPASGSDWNQRADKAAARSTKS